MSCASWAIRFAASLDGVLTVLSGMSTLEQMQDNLSYMKDFKKLDEKERAVMDQAQAEIQKVPIIPCTNCSYCAKVCPMNIGISATFNAMNVLKLYNNLTRAKRIIDMDVTGTGKNCANECIKCQEI